jgi:transposase
MSYQDHQPASCSCDDLRQEQILTPFQRKLLQKSLQDDLPEQYRQRIEIILLADEGKSQAQICQALRCSQGTARYWITLARAGQAHNWDAFPIGRPKNVNDQYLERLKELVSHSPRDYGYPFQRWTAQWLSKHLAKEFGIEVSDRHINRLLKEMGLSTRRKSDTAEKVMDAESTKDSTILIRDLQSSSSPSFLWSLNLIKTSN